MFAHDFVGYLRKSRSRVLLAYVTPSYLFFRSTCPVLFPNCSLFVFLIFRVGC